MNAKVCSAGPLQVSSTLADPLARAVFRSLTPLALYELKYGPRAAAAYAITSVWALPERTPSSSMRT
jgi:hypothetical protein